MIKKLADNISYYLCKELNHDDTKKEILSYGLQIILGTSSKIICILLLSFVFNIFETTIYVLISFIIFRRLIGGSHANTYNKCFFLSNFLILVLGGVGKLINASLINISISIILNYILSIIIAIIWIPMGTEKKMIKDRNTRLIIKLKAIILLTIWSISIIFLIYINNYSLSNLIFSSLLGVMLAFFLATPLGNKLTNFSII